MRNLVLFATIVGALLLAVCGVAAPAPQYDANKEAVFGLLDRLKNLDAYVVGEDGETLGKIAHYGDDALGNPYGAGSTYRQNGIFNPSSKYGSAVARTSAFNSGATKPPLIVYRRDNKIYIAGTLTTNQVIHVDGARIDPHLLQAWLKER